jgi:DNA-binding winged helix-turn-helix (wHTH) protein/Flp pilus assembly protein TadD
MTRPENLQWEFGCFRLDGSQHLLFREGELVPLSRKAVDILVVLLENHGHLVEKDSLMRRVWPDSFVEESNLAVHISQLRKTLGDDNAVCRIETIPRRGYRFVGEVRAPANPSAVTASSTDSSPVPDRRQSSTDRRQPSNKSRKWALILPASAAMLVVIAFVALRLDQQRKPPKAAPAVAAAAAPLTTDSIVLADIANNTGDPVFNTTLRQAMAIELEQSPFLRLVPESRLQQTLRLMGKSGDQPLTEEVSRELCQRNEGEAVLDGWIAKLGTQYVLGVRAINCRTGDHIADLQTTAAGKEQVLPALGDVTGQLRAKLGESLSTVQRFDTPIEEATTPSLEALQAYSLGRATMIQKGESSSCIPFLQRAIRLDPDFAIAYAALGNAYSNLGEMGLAETNTRRAYELRQRASEHERLYIEGHYYQFVTGDLTKATATYETWAATYPTDVAPRTDLAVIWSDLGKFGPSLDQAQAALRLAPDESQNYANLVNAYVSQDRVDEAKAVIDQATARNLDSSDLHLYRYDLAFLRHDPVGIDELMKWAAGEPGVEDIFLSHYADTLASAGQDAKAQQFIDRAVDTARRAGEKETAAGYEVDAAQREAIFGNLAEARRFAVAALALAHDRDTKYGAALAFGLAGSFSQANTLADQLNNDFPDDTFVQFIYLPAIRGAVALEQHDPNRAIRALDAATPYDIGVAGGLMQVYVRGLAYLAAGDGQHAQAQFEKIVAWPGVVLTSPIGPLANLQLARAYQLQGRHADAKAAYQQFLSAWKDADPGIPVLQSAKIEAAKL